MTADTLKALREIAYSYHNGNARLENRSFAERILHITDELDRLNAQLTRAMDALQMLPDEQNGPPLLKYEKSWQRAVDEARAVIAETKKEGAK